MQDFISHTGPRDKIYLLLGASFGAGITLNLFRYMSPDQAALVGAIAIAVLSFLSTQVGRPLLWWIGAGAIAGIIVGLAVAVKDSLGDGATPLDFRDRFIILGSQGLSGFISGAILGRKMHRTHVPPLEKFLTWASTLTVSVFSVVVTTSFLLEGLEVARTLSSRLSTTTAVLVTALVIPGIVGYLLFELDLPKHNGPHRP